MMRPTLSPVYVFNEDSLIWCRPDYSGIAYNDGDEVEQRLLKIVNSTADLTVLSGELKSHCTDWPSLYHLSGTRANILRPLEEGLHGKKVLEIGAGCGAITRYMGECGAHVLALEGSPRRAAIARSRTRDLDNIEVLAERFSAFETTEKFDVVTLIGVLEYASLFVDEEHADLAMLSRAKELLAPDGKLVIAIENQLGLKYFAGALEDHVSQASFGLENRYQPKGVRTYGKANLQALLTSSGFENTRFFAPFPDYKFPVTVVSEEGFENPYLDIGQLVAQSARLDPQLPNVLAFSPERVWPVLDRNQLALHLSNSFLVLAQQEPQSAIKEEIDLAWHFSTGRTKEFCKTTLFSESSEGWVSVSRVRSIRHLPTIGVRGDLTNTLEQREKLAVGTLLSTSISDVVVRDGWTDEDLIDVVSDYVEALRSTLGIEIALNSLTTQIISGKHIDAIPQNIIRTTTGKYFIFDQEWSWGRNISAAYLLFRGLLAICGSTTRIGNNRQWSAKSRYEFIAACFRAIGSPLTTEQLDEYCHLEVELQKLVSNSEVQSGLVIKSLQHWVSDPGNVWKNLDQLQVELKKANKEAAVLREQAERHQIELIRASQAYDTKIEAANHLLTERLKTIQQLHHIVHDRDATIQTLTQSRSWAITKPLRFATRMLGLFRKKSHAIKEDLVGSFALRISLFSGTPKSICACIHAYYPEALASMLEYLKESKIPLRLLITTTYDKKDVVAAIVSKYVFDHEIIVVENKGRDILPFLTAVRHTKDTELIVKLHTKKSLHRVDGDAWREDMIRKLLNSAQVEKTFRAFRKIPQLGMVAPEGHLLSFDEYIGHNLTKCNNILSRLRKKSNYIENRVFSGGTMFFVRKSALESLLDVQFQSDDFEPELGQIDGTLAHALERVLGLCVGYSGFIISSTDHLGVKANPRANLIHTDPKVRQ